MTQHGRKRTTSLSARFFCAAGLAMLTATLLALPAAAAAVGRAFIVSGSTNHLVNAGGSQTPFAVGLPPRAKCPGDSTRMPFYRAYTYLVPKGTSPTAVNFKTGSPDHWYGLYSYGSYLGAVNLAVGTGQIAPSLPANFTFPPLVVAHLLPSGAGAATWETGVACTTYKGNVVSYWNVEVTISPSSKDAGGYTWTVTQRVPSSTKRSDVLFEVVGFGVAIVLALGAVLLVRSSRRPASSVSP